jgi:GntR family transcriptional regulator
LIELKKEIFIKVDNEQLFQKVKRAVMQLIKHYVSESKDRLPPEAELGARLGVSRTVVRDVLSDFEAKGFISRRRGIGTIINTHVLQADARLDIDQEIIEVLIQKGYTPSVGNIHFETVIADDDVADRLKLNSGEEILKVVSVVCADGVPAVHIIDRLPMAIIVEPYDFDDFKVSIFEFMREKCSEQIESDLSHVKPVIADEKLAKIFKIDPCEPLLYLDEVGYTAGNVPVLLSEEYFNPKVFDFSVFRRKL